MFDLEILIASDDLFSEERMEATRLTMDAAAKAHHSSATFSREVVESYHAQIKTQGSDEVVTLPETDETRAYRVLRRFYE
jgi:ATP-dependent Clp protease adapter protein ClpS